MDIIEIIIGLLVIGVPLIFRLIGRRLEKSGSETAGQFRKIAEAFDDEQGDPFEGVTVVYEMPEEARTATVSDEAPRQIEPKAQKPAKPVAKPVKPKKTVLLEEKSEKVEKIDPKKLVIYSEIMKPKY